MKKELPLYENKNFYTIGKYLKESKQSYNHMIDYTYLNNKASIDDIKKICDTAIENKCYAVCVMPKFVGTAKVFLEDSDVKLVTIISFPKGTDKTVQKIKEADKAISDGVDEIDMVMNYKKLKELIEVSKDSEEYTKKYDDIMDDIRQLTILCHTNNTIIKVIIESSDLTYDQIRTACEMCVKSSVDFIKTSTGFSDSGTGAELEKVKYMRKILPDNVKIKASGGIRTLEQVEKFAPYVDRIGTSIVPGGEETEENIYKV